MVIVVSAFYKLNSKLNINIYIKWAQNLINNVNNFKLIIFTNKESYNIINNIIPKNNDKIKLILLELHEFYNYKYKDNWIKNHVKNNLLKDKISWEVNMLWSEKIEFIKKVSNTEIDDLYIWCDIGYFRNTMKDTNINVLQNWCNKHKINMLDKTKIHYGLVNNNINEIINIINDSNQYGIPNRDIPPYQISVSGGFFIIHKDNINWWFNTYDNMLQKYFENNKLVKDDQMIIINCIIKNRDKFILHTEKNKKYDNWFMFQRILQ